MAEALIIIDIQNDYFENGAMQLVEAEKAGNNARLLLEHFRKEMLPVIHIQHIANRPGATYFLPGTMGVEIQNVVKPRSNEKIIIKHFPNSFRETELLDYLKSKNISDLVICGMMTHMCVDSTTRAAKDFGYNCVVIGDACSTKDLGLNGVRVKASDVQTAILSALNNFYSTVKMTNEYLNRNEVPK